MNCLMKDCDEVVEGDRRTCKLCYSNFEIKSKQELDRANKTAFATKKLYIEVLKSGTSDQQKKTRKLFKDSIDHYENLFEVIQRANVEYTKTRSCDDGGSHLLHLV